MILATYDSDLFGDAPEIPRAGTKERLAYVNDLKLPDGLKFWALAPRHGIVSAPDYVETIWCRNRADQWVKLVVDLRTGEKWVVE